MKFLIILLVLLGPLLGLVSAQSTSSKTPDFTGTWRLEGYRKKGFSTTLTISQTSTSINVIQEDTRGGPVERKETVYYTDGRGEENLVAPGAIEHTKTFWKKDKLRIEFLNRPTPDSNPILINSAEWKLSKNGKELKQTRRLMAGPPSLAIGSSIRAVSSAETRTYRRL